MVLCLNALVCGNITNFFPTIAAATGTPSQSTWSITTTDTPSPPVTETTPTFTNDNDDGLTSSISASRFASSPPSLTPPPSYGLSSPTTLFSIPRSPPPPTLPSTESTPSTTSSPSSASPPSASPPFSSTLQISPTSTTPSSTPHSDVGIIAGAVAGGLAILASVILILCFRRRKRKMETGKDLDTRARTFTLTPPETASDRTEDRLPQPVMSEMASDPSRGLPTYTPPQQIYGRSLTDEKSDFNDGFQAGNGERMLTHEESGVADDEDVPGFPGGSSRGSISMVSAPPSYASEERVIDESTS
ncbi:hypothetical protein BV22DRAFT_1126814 [Leucogyrophana mollusca]|uniref:Uncharacterized protein n=1 Tax=Leucogyrophana mollusca TaxID=85980 RepID=A0ACB8BT31_9AGAM|nr:hypothetical protein BV22DRAFT_1126814 [Leucogyrophana mollusca]